MTAESFDQSSPALKFKRRTVRLLPLLWLGLCSCSFQNFVLIVNMHGESRQVNLQFDSPQSGLPVFSTRDLAVYQIKSNKVDFSSHRSLAQAEAASLTIEIPAHSALRIAVLRNEYFVSSKQNFINDRVFNLRQIIAGEMTVTKDNFNDYFKTTNFGAAFNIP